MVVGIGSLTLYIQECHSLKAKRKVVKALIARLRNNFNASVAEVGANDMHQKARIGFAVMGNDTQVINSKLDKMFNFVETLGLAEVLDSELEIIHL
jgi:uncharacterized protein YlxP (DUF503 family)